MGLLGFQLGSRFKFRVGFKFSVLPPPKKGICGAGHLHVGMETRAHKDTHTQPRRLKPARRALTRGRQEVRVVVVRLLERVVRVRRQDGRGRHQRVPIVQQRNPGGQGAVEVLGGHLSEGLGLVEQDVLDEEGGRPLGSHRVHPVRGEVEVHLPALAGGPGLGVSPTFGEGSWLAGWLAASLALFRGVPRMLRCSAAFLDAEEPREESEVDLELSGGGVVWFEL